MAHQAQSDFINSIKARYPDYFDGVSVLDVGSFDVNGNARKFFTNSEYFGIDIIPGRNVDLVCSAVEYANTKLVRHDVVVCAEMLEHDIDWKNSLQAIYDVLLPCGMLLITAATTGRKEHGTHLNKPGDSKGTLDHYMNITEEHLRSVYSADTFEIFEVSGNDNPNDIYLFGIKLGE